MTTALKSRKWLHTFPPGASQDGWRWFDIRDAGPYKSTFNGPHDLPGGARCDLCGTWHRYVHYLRHKDVPGVVLKVGSDCATYLTGGLNCYLIEEEFIRSQERWERDEAARKRREAEEAARQQRAAEERLRQAAEIAACLQQEKEERQQREAAMAVARQRQSERAETAARECLAHLEELRASWCDEWLPCRTNPEHFKKKISFGLFEVDATLFQSQRRPGYYRFVLNAPEETIWAKRDYPHPAQAARALYDALYDYVETMHLTHPASLQGYMDRARVQPSGLCQRSVLN